MGSESTNEKQEKQEVRVWMDGCFDLVHFGHANACRQAKAMGSYLIVGVHSDAEIAKHKGPPVFTEQERYKLVRAIKWVDEVVENAPYLPTIETLEKYNCAFCVHGDDLTMSTDGVDHLHVVKAAGRYRDCQRTVEISTTNLIGRMLLMPKTHDECDNIFRDRKHTPCKSSVSSRTYTLQSLSIMDKIKQFSNDRRPNPNDRIIYTCGAYDLFHAGHVSFLEKAKTFGDYLIVGLYTDSDINRYKSNDRPVMNIHERVLSVLACRFVDEVVIGAPYTITLDLISHFKVDIVLHGRSERQVDEDGRNPYEVPKRLNKFKEIDSGSTLTTADVITRIIENRLEYERRNAKKEADDLEVYEKFGSKNKQESLGVNIH